ncbi:hypothetical protein [Polynucleobacter asymbioticus]|jgi:hypothetical protein|uniref:hypothetical protein n=1 Tax=Polynucleobacter asymbioticus TaxID=576611 RepID=UPI0019017437|nr:hypothetical protein [Polynucleobacter asymbioticus]
MDSQKLKKPKKKKVVCFFISYHKEKSPLPAITAEHLKRLAKDPKRPNKGEKND